MFRCLQLCCHGFDSRRVCAMAHRWQICRSSLASSWGFPSFTRDGREFIVVLRLRDTSSCRARAYFCSCAQRPCASCEPACDWDYFSAERWLACLVFVLAVVILFARAGHNNFIPVTVPYPTFSSLVTYSFVYRYRLSSQLHPRLLVGRWHGKS
jgi:hypothetical protein